MKTVFNSEMTAHVWAALSQPHGRNSADSMSFDGSVAYSYRTPVAHIVETGEIHGASAQRIALFHSDSFSTTTNGRHLPKYRRAVRDNVERTFTVPDLLLGLFHATNEHPGHGVNVAYLQAQYDKEVAELMRSPCDSWKVADIDIDSEMPQYSDAGYVGRQTMPHVKLWRIAEGIREYVDAFVLQRKVADWGRDWNGDGDKIIARRDRLLADPKRAAKREAGRVQREALEARRIAERAREQAERNAAAMEAWTEGWPMFGRSRVSDAEGGALLRMSPGRYEVETSWGAEVPARDARMVLKFYDRVRAEQAAGELVTWVRGDDSINESRFILGSFALDRINADGSIKVGCHTINAPEIEKIRAALDK